MSIPNYEQIGVQLKVLAHPVRLRILDALRRDAECVCHLETLLEKPQPYVSQQLRLLREAGFIQDEKEGQNVYYRLMNAEVETWLRAILDDPQEQPAGPMGHTQFVNCVCPKCASAVTVLDLA